MRYHEQAIAARRAHRLVVAERAGRRAVALYTAIEGPGHPDVANALIEVGQACEARDRLREARRCHRRALAILTVAVPARAAVDEELGRLVVRAWMLLAGVERALGHLAPADALYRRAAVEARRRLPARDRDVVGLLNNRGMLRKFQGRFAEAIRFYRRALAMVGTRGDRDALATLHHNLGGVEHARGRFAAGEPHARRSVALREAALGPHHVLVAADVAALAALVDGVGRLDEAAALYQRALRVFRRRLGPRSLEVGLTLAGLADVRQKQGPVVAAERLYRQSLSILERILGRRHPDVALTLNNLAHLLREAGQLARAERLYRRALAIFEASLGRRHPHTRRCRASHRSLSRIRDR